MVRDVGLLLQSLTRYSVEVIYYSLNMSVNHSLLTSSADTLDQIESP